jgi:hypothetical protein
VFVTKIFENSRSPLRQGPGLDKTKRQAAEFPQYFRLGLAARDALCAVILRDALTKTDVLDWE